MYRLAYYPFLQTVAGRVLSRMFSGTVVVYEDERKAIAAFDEFVELAGEVVAPFDRGTVFGILALVNTRDITIVTQALIAKRV